MRIIIARHGKTNENDQRKISGNSNKAQLIEEGFKHAQNMKELLKNEKIEAIFSSPLDRAMDTARPLAKALNLEIEKIEELREFDFGTIDGECMDPEGSKWLQKRREDYHFRFPEGESYADVLKRIGKFLEELKEKSFSEVLIQGHCATNRAILSILTKTRPEILDTINTPNAIVYKIDTETDECSWTNSLTGEKGTDLLFRTFL